MPEPTIRPATPSDFATLQEIELAAGQLFADIGMPDIADDEPFSIAELGEYAERGQAWVLADADDRPIGYVLVDLVGACAHIEQVSVHPATTGRATADS